MKLTQRDKIMLSVLVIALSLFCGIWFILRPAFKDVQSSKKDYNELRSDYQAKLEQVEAKKNIVNDVEAMYQECLEISGKFYSYKVPEDVAEEIFNIFSDNEITVTSSNFNLSSKVLNVYSYRPPVGIYVPLDEYANINDTTEEVVESTAPSETIGCYTFNINFEDMTREKIFSLVEELKTYDQKTLVITNLSFNVPEADSADGCSGTVTLDMYYMNAPQKPITE